MAERVAVLWRDITDWLHRNAPASAAQIRPPATDALLAGIRAELGRPLPADLRRWWRQADGVSNPVLAVLIPDCFSPMPVQEAWESRADCLRLTGAPVDDEPAVDVAGDDRLSEFHPLFLPIGTDTCGNFLCVDLRDGPRHGCVGEWSHEDGWGDTLYWESVTEMLADIRAALVDGRPALAGRAARRRQRFVHAYTSVSRAGVTPNRELEWIHIDTSDTGR